MWIMVVYVLIVGVSELIVVAIGLVLDRTFPLASLPNFFDAVLCGPLGWLGSCGTMDGSCQASQTLKLRIACMSAFS